MNFLLLVFVTSALILSFLLTYFVRTYTIKQKILDIPNERSSHVVVTPRGGGLGFVVVFLLSLCILFYMGLIELHPFLALVGGGVLISSVGWKDDKAGLTPQVRSFFHFFAAAWAVYWLGGFPAINVGFADLHLAWVGSIVAVVGTVWMINLYNFMDGVDGIAGTEAVSVAIIAAFCLGQAVGGQVLVCLLLAASVLGFLIWNWPPAKIFMGDVGSGFLGFIFAVMAMWTEQSGALPFIIWMMLLGVFIIDATVTLVKRLARKEKLYEAHRSHVYQLAVQVGYSHKRVTCTVLIINIILGILAVLELTYRTYLLGICIGAAILLIGVHIILANRFNRRIIKLAVKAANKEVDQSYKEAAALVDDEF